MTTQIIINQNQTCQIQNEQDFNFLGFLDEELSFLVQGYEHAFTYKMGKWNGKKRLLSHNLSFAYGLLSRVKEFYQNHNKQIEVIDRRLPKSPNMSIDLLPILEAKNNKPFHYQLEAVEAIKKNDIGVIKLATGSGKSNIACMMTACFGKKTIIFVVTKALLHQTHDLFSSIFRQKIGKVGDGICEIEDINIISIWSVGAALGVKNVALDEAESENGLDVNRYQEIISLIENVQVCIFDECHCCSSDTFVEVAKHLKSVEHIYGLTATPASLREDNAGLIAEAILGPVIIDYSASYMIENDFLVRPTIQFVRAPKIQDKIPKQYQSIYKQCIVENEGRNNLIVQEALKLIAEQRPTLVLYSSLNHGKILFDLLNRKTSCKLLSGKDSTEDRNQAIEEISNGTLKCLLASRIFDLGINITCLSGLIISFGGTSAIRNLQRCGRILRKFPGKIDAKIIDFYDDVKYLRDHSKRRMEIYQTEPAFKIIK